MIQGMCHIYLTKGGKKISATKITTILGYETMSALLYLYHGYLVTRRTAYHLFVDIF